MKVTIITVAYNSAKTINDTLLSVLSQSYNDIEYIVIDGGSADNTMQIVNSYASAGIVVVSEPDKGIYDAMNKGITMAKGEVIALINSDDIYEDENVVSDVMGRFKASPTIDMVYGDLVYVKSDDVNKIVRKWRSISNYSTFFDHGNVPPHPTLFVKKMVYEAAGLFRLDYKLASDYEFMLRIFKKFKFNAIYMPRLMVRMRLGGVTNNSLSNILKGNREIMKAWKDNGFRVPILLMPLRLIKRLVQFI